MILTIALNPGIEKHLGIDTYKEGEIIPVTTYTLSIAGSSVYSAYIMKQLQADPYVLGFAGGIGGRYIKNFMDKSRIKSNLIIKDKEVKMSVGITNKQGVKTWLINEGESFQTSDWANLKHTLVRQIDEAEVLVVNGDLSHEGASELLLDCVMLAKSKHTKMIVSIDGEDIDPFLKLGPFAVVLTEEQVENLTRDCDSLEETLEVLRALAVTYHIHNIYFISGNEVIGVTRNKIAYGSISGHGHQQVSWKKDAMVGGLAISIKRKYEFERTLKLTSGVCYAVSDEAYPVLCTRKKIDEMTRKSKVATYYSGGSYSIEKA